MNYFKNRIEKLNHYLNQSNYDGMYVSNITNVRYMSGFTGSSGFLLFINDEKHFFSDGRYTEQAKNQVSDFQIHITSNHFKEIQNMGILKKGMNIAFEADHLSVSTFENLKNNFDVNLESTSSIIENIAAVKDENEINCLKTAIEITDLAFDLIIPELKVGATEKEIAAKLAYIFKTNGAEGESYDSIIGSGANGALPHATPSDKKFESGDFVVMDFGALYGGYHADMTRTVVINKKTSKHDEIYNLVLKSQLAGIDRAAAGVKCSEVDKSCRDVIKDAGYGEFFMHGTGHGIGLEVHTLPRVSWVNHEALITNNVITIEPGIYLADWGGVRIEDDCQILDNGCLPLNKSTKELLVL